MSTQFSFLNTLRRERRLVVLYLIGGTRLQGRIASFDQQGVLLETKTGMVLCSQDQISTVGPDAPRAALRPRSRAGVSVAAHGSGLRDEPKLPSVQTPLPVSEPEDEPLSARVEHSANGALHPSATAQRPTIVTQKARRKIVRPDLQTGTSG
jgi:RNA chaperone Hfq